MPCLLKENTCIGALIMLFSNNKATNIQEINTDMTYIKKAFFMNAFFNGTDKRLTS